MKTTKGNWVFSIVFLLAPLLYLSMYLPIWNGKELLLSFTKPGVFAIILFVFHCISAVLAILRLAIGKLRNRDTCLTAIVFGFFFVGSLVLTGFVGFLFLLELFNIPWFPAQQ